MCEFEREHQTGGVGEAWDVGMVLEMNYNLIYTVNQYSVALPHIVSVNILVPYRIC